MNLCPNVFIVILNYNGLDVLRACLLSVFRVKYPNFQVVLVDNDSTDGSFEEARLNFSRCHFIKNESNLGYAAGNNVGIRFALERGAEFVLLLNSDTTVDPDFLAGLIEVARKDSEARLLSPLIYNPDRSVWFSGGRVDWMRMKTKHIQALPKRNNAYSTGFASGCCLMVKNEVFKKIGLLDEGFFLYWEDADFCVRAKRAGFGVVVVPASRIVHLEKSNQKAENKIYWLVLSGLLFFKKNKPLYLSPWLWLYVLIRRLKNKIDQKFHPTDISRAVYRAYSDFYKHG